MLILQSSALLKRLGIRDYEDLAKDFQMILQKSNQANQSDNLNITDAGGR
ncbi:hypothetical protein [Caedibacter taeniospiralis]|uniref:Uncharacterized protein n=1 Tax=Caedibacter taeniospiralis TaxID=28907 RepID=Q6TFG6_CAETA|nr:hypothetical protein [Caedibacter taeniospiralis]AAR87093.1 hypothetical protein [Caedibacter taeniospiralis]